MADFHDAETATSLNVADIRASFAKRGRRLEYITIGWNAVEAAVAIAAGLYAGSIALVGFGLDSVIETTSGAALLWRLHLDDPARRERAERIALKIVGVCFVVLAAYVAYDSGMSLYRRERPDESVPGIVIAVASLIAMPLLARAKRRVNDVIKSRALHVDSRQTDICAYLSGILLGGLLLNLLLGWWWADPVAALLMVPLIAYEGVEALRGKDPCKCD